ncbi:MAG: hypothetical protein Q4D13_02075 [Erysipelotrichaceae bacterium]|nr:hypothetical protein [Erysipelotrichaceae bacterium]
MEQKIKVKKKSARQVVKDVQMLLTSYKYASRVLLEDDTHIINRPRKEVSRSVYIARHIENVIESLNDRDRFILRNEFVLGKSGKWYIGYYSDSTYYRNRIKAYRAFLLELEK